MNRYREVANKLVKTLWELHSAQQDNEMVLEIERSLKQIALDAKREGKIEGMDIAIEVANNLWFNHPDRHKLALTPDIVIYNILEKIKAAKDKL